MGSDLLDRVRALGTRIGQEIAENAGAATQIAIVSMVAFVPFVLRVDGEGLHLSSRSSFLLAVGAVLIALLSRWVFFVFSLVYVPLTLVSVHIVRHFGGDARGWRLNQPDSRVEVFLESPQGETLEYLQSILWPSDYVLIVLSALYLVILGYVFRTRPRLSMVAKVMVTLLLVACSALYLQFRKKNDLEQWPQYQLARATVEAGPRYQRLLDRAAYLAQQELPRGNCTSRYSKVVIVLGESVSALHMSAFGYEKETTPFADASSPYAIEALAPANVTRVSLALMLTAVEPENFDAFYQTHSLVSQLRACGYYTVWISNQGRVGRQDSLASSIAREADRQVFLNELSYKEVQYDEAILAELESLGAFRTDGQATFIHLIGSHTSYARRYPRGFGFAERSTVVDAYDNSILYTDYVLSLLHEKFGSRGVLLVYVADHGEVVSNRVHGHGFTPGFREEYRVPLLIWSEDTASIGQLQAAIGTSRLNLESFDGLINFLVGNTSAPQLSTRDVVTNLSAENPVRYEDLRPFRPQSSESHE